MASKKISEFTQQTDFQQTDLLNIVRSGTNYSVPFSAAAAALGVTGTINIVGGAGTPILEQPSGTINNIRTIEDGSGIISSISAQNGIKLAHNFTVNKSGVALITDETVASPVFRSIAAGSGVAVAASGDVITISASATASGGSINTSVYLAKNGSVITDSKCPVVVSSSISDQISIPWQVDMSKDDYLEVFVENNSNTVNLIVQRCALRVN